MDPRDAFISYVEEDAAFAGALGTELRGLGHSTWTYEDDGIPGESYLTQVHAAIAVCKVFILVATPQSVHAHQVIREVEQAHEQQKIIIPVREDYSRRLRLRQPYPANGEWNCSVVVL